MAVIWKLTKRIIIPAGAVVSIPFVVPLMYASDAAESGDDSLVKPSDLPIYDDSEKFSQNQTQDQSKTGAQKAEHEPGYLLQGVSSVRKSIFNSVAKLDESKEAAVQYYEIGKEHSKNAYSYLTAEENVIPRAVAITVGGLSGLLFSARKGVFKKMMYTTTGLVGMSFVCYPKQATQVSLDAYKIGKYYVLMAYTKLQESGGPKKP